MVRREVRATGRGTSRRGPSGRSDGHPACRPPQSHRFSLDKRMRSVSNACSAEAGEVPDNQVNAHLGNPGSIFPFFGSFGEIGIGFVRRLAKFGSFGAISFRCLEMCHCWPRRV
jgi:hypothetical protein